MQISDYVRFQKIKKVRGKNIMSYKDSQYKRVEDLIRSSDIFNGDSGDGKFGGKNYRFVLNNNINNLYPSIRDGVLKYFEKNRIAWWKGKLTNHTLSSQVSCLNHLFPLRDDKKAVLSIVRGFQPDIIEVLSITSDRHKPAYIQFEAVSDVDYLNENSSTRGRNCTSIDALIFGQNKSGKKILVVIEWKYVEKYWNKDKGSGEKGKTRKKRYTDIINNSKQLKTEHHGAFYYEPFYQLMRQTIWAEQMIINSNEETVKADDYIHIHVIPKENKELLNKKHVSSGEGMEKTWRSLIKDQDKYRIITPKDLLEPINSDNRYRHLVNYLETRYW